MPIFKELKDVMGFVDPVTHEDQEFNKPYLLLLKTDEEEGTSQDGYEEFSGVAIRGRRLVFDYLSQRLGSFDIIHSYVMSGKISLGSEVSVYTFLRLCVTRFFPQSPNGLTVDDLDSIALDYGSVPSDFDLDVLFQRETNRPS